MTQQEMFKLFEQIYARDIEKMKEKNEEYARPENAFSNFEAMAYKNNCSKEEALYEQLSKHLAWLDDYRNKKFNLEIAKEHLGDIRIFCAILQIMLNENFNLNNLED
ncbi:MAG: hypothetical protein ABFD00_03830 [Chloroherpetonaceae bacterium]